MLMRYRPRSKAGRPPEGGIKGEFEGMPMWYRTFEPINPKDVEEGLEARYDVPEGWQTLQDVVNKVTPTPKAEGADGNDDDNSD